MALLTKLGIALILLLGAGLGGSLWYSNTVAKERDSAQSRVGKLETVIEMTTLEEQERKLTNERLSKALVARSQREAELLAASRRVQERIDALPTTCTFSAESNRLLWEIYDSAAGVPPAPSE